MADRVLEPAEMMVGPDCASGGPRWRAPGRRPLRRPVTMQVLVACVVAPPRIARHGAVLIRIVDLNVEDVRDIAPRNDLRRTIQNETAR